MTECEYKWRLTRPDFGAFRAAEDTFIIQVVGLQLWTPTQDRDAHNKLVGDCVLELIAGDKYQLTLPGCLCVTHVNDIPWTVTQITQECKTVAQHDCWSDFDINMSLEIETAPRRQKPFDAPALGVRPFRLLLPIAIPRHQHYNWTLHVDGHVERLENTIVFADVKQVATHD